MRGGFLAVVGATAAMCLLAAVAGASAQTLGQLPTTDPGACPANTQSESWIQTQTASAHYTVPTTGLITSWRTAFDTTGDPVELVVTGPGSSSQSVVGFDSESFPSISVGTHAATFALSQPIYVQAGDQIGLWYTGSSDTRCIFYTGNSSDTVTWGETQPTSGGSLSTINSLSDYLTDVTANLVTSIDVAVTGRVSPATVPTGQLTDATFRLAGSTSENEVLSVSVPAGLTPVKAFAQGGSCAVSGRDNVTCVLQSLPSTVDVLLRGKAAGKQTVTAKILSPELPDPNAANNTATATVTVKAPVCTVPVLKGAPLAVAKSVLPLVGCQVGKVTDTKSKSIAKGDVISTSPAAGSKEPLKTKVALKVSSGR